MISAAENLGFLRPVVAASGELTKMRQPRDRLARVGAATLSADGTSMSTPNARPKYFNLFAASWFSH